MQKKGGRCQWLHMLIYFSFVYSLSLLLVFVMRSSRTENSRPLLRIVNGWCCKAYSLSLSRVGRVFLTFPFSIINITYSSIESKEIKKHFAPPAFWDFFSYIFWDFFSQIFFLYTRSSFNHMFPKSLTWYQHLLDTLNIHSEKIPCSCLHSSFRYLCLFILSIII